MAKFRRRRGRPGDKSSNKSSNALNPFAAIIGDGGPVDFKFVAPLISDSGSVVRKKRALSVAETMPGASASLFQDDPAARRDRHKDLVSAPPTASESMRMSVRRFLESRQAGGKQE
jgi:hypothetical protein